MSENIIRQDIGDTCTDYSKIHGANVNMSRALPDERDGLKPVFRRILVAMGVDYKMNNSSNTIKCSAITGTVAAKYHPHGSPIKTLAMMAQPFSLSVPLIEGQGNFGNIQGDENSADRYIEAKLSKYAYECFFSEYNSDILDMQQAANKIDEIAEYLPCKYPNLLVNGSFGIGYALSTAIPPHNLNEVILATIKLIKNPKAKILLIPDIPTGCDILDCDKFGKINETGRGSYRMRATAEIKEMNINGKSELVIQFKNVPYQTNTANIKDKIVQLVNAKKCTFIKDVHDDTKENDVDLKIIINKLMNPYKCLEFLYDNTDLQTSGLVNINVVKDCEVIAYNYKELLLGWIDYRREFKLRVINNKIMELKTRIMVLDGLISMLTNKNFNKLMNEMRTTCTCKADTVSYLMEYFKISDLQAERIAELSLYSINDSSLNRYMNEKTDKDTQANELDAIRKNMSMIDNIIMLELADGMDKFGYKRRSKMYTEEESNNIVPLSSHAVIITSSGYIKKLPDNSDSFGKIPKGDVILHMYKSISDDKVLSVFTSDGYMYRLPLKDIADSTKVSFGVNIKEYLKLDTNINIVAVMDITETIAEKNVYDRLVFLTEQGLIKMSETSLYTETKVNSLMAIKLSDDDHVTKVCGINTSIDNILMLYTNKGKGLILNVDELNTTARMSKGSRGISLDDNDKLIGMDILEPYQDSLLVVTNKNRIKLTNIPATTGRNGKSFVISSCDEDEYISRVYNFRIDDTVIAKLDTGDVVDISPRNFKEKTRMNKCDKVDGINISDSIIYIGIE